MAAITHLGIREFAPVIFTGTSGNPGDYHASANQDAPEDHIIEAGVPARSRIIDAWYTPYHAIANITRFAFIDVNRHNDTQVLLRLAGYDNSNVRVRINVHVHYVMGQ